MKHRVQLICTILLVFGAARLSAQTQSTTDQTVSAGTPQSGQTAPSQTPPGPSAPTDQTPTASNTAQNPAQNPPAPVQEPDPSKVKHDGGKDDVDAVGNRKMGG